MGAVPNVAVFCSSLISCFPVMFLRYCQNDFEVVPVAAAIAAITFIFTFHMCCTSVVGSSFFIIFPAAFLITFLPPAIATSIDMFPFHYHGL